MQKLWRQSNENLQNHTTTNKDLLSLQKESKNKKQYIKQLPTTSKLTTVYRNKLKNNNIISRGKSPYQNYCKERQTKKINSVKKKQNPKISNLSLALIFNSIDLDESVKLKQLNSRKKSWKFNLPQNCFQNIILKLVFWRKIRRKNFFRIALSKKALKIFNFIVHFVTIISIFTKITKANNNLLSQNNKSAYIFQNSPQYYIKFRRLFQMEENGQTFKNIFHGKKGKINFLVYIKNIFYIALRTTELNKWYSFLKSFIF